MLDLPGVMLCAASSVALEKTREALERSTRSVRYGDVVLFSDRGDSARDAGQGIRLENIPPLISREAYSRFILKGLVERTTCNHVLVVQWDGFVCNPQAWRDEFLEYDYIGAPWPHFAPPFNIGNGGFSLRSKRLLAALATDRFVAQGPEDVLICRDWRPELEESYGIKFAPAEIATCFSFERSRPPGPTFGFHGLFNIPDVIPEHELQKWLANLRADDLLTRDADDLIFRLATGKHRRTALSLYLRRAIATMRTGMSTASSIRLISALLCGERARADKQLF